MENRVIKISDNFTFKMRDIDGEWMIDKKGGLLGNYSKKWDKYVDAYFEGYNEVWGYKDVDLPNFEELEEIFKK